MNINTDISNKAKLKAITAIVTILIFGWFMTMYVLQSHAEQSKIAISISPSGGQIPEEPISFIIRPEKAGEKISGVDLRTTVENGVMISWDGISNLDSTGNELFTELVKEVSGGAGRYSASVIKGDNQLPTGVIVRGTIACTSNNPVTVKINTNTSQFVGPVEGSKFVISGINEMQYTCGSGSNLPPGNEQVTATFEPETCTAGVGNACTYRLRVATRDPQNKISGYHIKLAYDKTILKGADAKGPGNVRTSMDVLGLLAQTAATPTPSNTPTPTGAQTPTTRPTSTPTPTPTTVPATPTTGAITNPTTSVTGGAVTRMTPTPGTSTGTNPGTRVTIPPGSATQCTTTQQCIDALCGGVPSEQCKYDCIISPGQTTGACKKIEGRPSGAPIPNPSGTGPSSCQTVGAYINQEAGEIDLLYACTGSAQTLYSSYINTFVFQSLKEGSGAITIKSIQVVGPQGNPEYTVYKGEGKYNIGTGGAGDVELKMKLRLQGILKKPKTKDTIRVKIGIGDGGLRKPVYNTAEFKVDDKGIWHGSVKFDVKTNATANFDVDSAAGYKVLIKPEYHMQRKFCVSSPKETSPGTEKCDKGQVLLKKGVNEIDLSGVIQLVCDIPPGDQDGMCNAKDQALFRSLIGKKDEASLKLGDVNFDGVVNAVDHSLMISSMSVRWDEE